MKLAAVVLFASPIAACMRSDPTMQPPGPNDTAPKHLAEKKVDELPIGTMTEEEFKAKHELTGAASPAPRGTVVEVAGTRAYLSLPATGERPTAGVVVIHEWWGLNDHIRHYADRLATEGYAALAIDLFGGNVATDADRAMELVKNVDDARSQETLIAAHRFLATDSRVRASKRGVIGWCFGGGWALRHAMVVDGLDAVVIYYGRLITDPGRLATIEAPILGVFANRDQGIPPPEVDRFEKALTAAHRNFEIRRYDADHAFANPSGPRYQQDAAADAWRATSEFLAKHLAGGR